MHLAAENGHDQVADVLLWHKAFVNAKSKQGVTPLHLSAQNGYNKLVKLLIETHGATIDALSLVWLNDIPVYSHWFNSSFINVF